MYVGDFDNRSNEMISYATRIRNVVVKIRLSTKPFRLTFHDIRSTRRLDLETTSRGGNGKMAACAEQRYVHGRRRFNANDRDAKFTSCDQPNGQQRAQNCRENGGKRRRVAARWGSRGAESDWPANVMRCCRRRRFSGHNI